MPSTAPAKIILFGEHAVVYGQPAIAVPFNTLTATAEATPAPPGTGLNIIAKDIGKSLRVHIEDDAVDNALMYAAQLTLKALKKDPPDLNLEVSSTIPLASGFGSGAAIAAVLIRELSKALGSPLEGEELNALVYEVEKLHHGTPSGIDNTVIVMNTPIFYVKGYEPESFSVGKALTFVVADSGVSASTKETVGAVRKLYERDTVTYGNHITQIGDIVREARQHIRKGYLLGVAHTMNLNHNVLKKLTVSSDLLDKLTRTARDAGALGAKLSGGGRGGNIIALVEAELSEKVSQALKNAGAVHTWTMTLNVTREG